MSTSLFNLELSRPWYLAALLIVPVIYYFYRRSLVDFPRAQRRVSMIVRSLILLLIVLALAGLTIMWPTQREFVVFVVDESLSVDEDASNEALTLIQKAREFQGDHEARYLPFARNSHIATDIPAPEKNNSEKPEQQEDSSEEASPDEQPVSLTAEEPDGDTEPEIAEANTMENLDESKLATNIAESLQLAVASIPPFYKPRIVLLSDGNETHGDAIQAAVSSGVPIDTISMKTRQDPEVQVSNVEVPAQVRQGEPFYLEVTINSNVESEGTVEIYRGPHLLDSSRQKIKAGKNEFRFRQTIDDERLAEYSVRISGCEDSLLDNNVASGLVFTSGQPRVLLIDSNPRSVRELKWGLAEQDIVCDERPPEGIPTSLSDIQNYEAVILSNVPATALTTRQMEIIRTYVQDLGGGFLMLGGDQSFGLGGYYKSILEEILPVRSDFEKEKEKPSLAMVLIVDKSGSMGGIKIELAKDASKAAVELLGGRDQLGVVAFDGASYWVSELHPASDKSFIIDRISSIQASGGTNIYPAMEMAYEALSAANAKLKHVILLTDGHSSPGDFQGMAQQMASNRITLSTVAVGSSADQTLLEELAKIGSGRYYFCDDPQSVPQIFAKETVTASKSAINEQPFIPQMVRPTPVLANLAMDQAPFLLGYVVTRPKPTSEFILASEAGDPLLVWWRYGLGMTVAFTSDAKSRWAAEWVSWPDFGTFWAQVIRHAMRKGDTKGAFVEVERDSETTRLTLDTVDEIGQFRNKLKTELTLIGPSLETESLNMTQIAPGRYQASIPTDEKGTYHLEMSQLDEGQPVLHQSRGIVVGYPDELRLQPPDEDKLQRIAELSGGRFNPEPEEIFNVTDEPTYKAEPLWPYLLMGALVIFLLDVALRRVDFSLFRKYS
jgi:uncharacterized membrane protein